MSGIKNIYQEQSDDMTGNEIFLLVEGKELEISIEDNCQDKMLYVKLDKEQSLKLAQSIINYYK